MVSENEQGEHQKSENQRGAAPHSSDGGVLGKIAGFFMRDGSLGSLAREALKDVQSTFHEAAWGQREHGREPGAPLTPLHSDIEKARDFYAPRPDLPSPGGTAKGQSSTAAEQPKSTVHGQPRGDQAERGNGTVHGKGTTQYAQEFVMPEGMPEAMPEPLPDPAPVPEAAPAGEGAASQGRAPRGSGFLDRVEAERGYRGGNSDEGFSHVDRVNAGRAQQGNNNGGSPAQGRSLPDEPTGPDRGGRGR